MSMANLTKMKEKFNNKYLEIPVFESTVTQKWVLLRDKDPN